MGEPGFFNLLSTWSAYLAGTKLIISMPCEDVSDYQVALPGLI